MLNKSSSYPRDYIFWEIFRYRVLAFRTNTAFFIAKIIIDILFKTKTKNNNHKKKKNKNKKKSLKENWFLEPEAQTLRGRVRIQVSRLMSLFYLVQ